jgi:hypothetical protein
MAVRHVEIPVSRSREDAWRVSPETCSVLINVRRMELQARLDSLPTSAREHPSYEAARRWLTEAESAAVDPGGVVASLRDWWSGERIERGWSAVHQAEDALLMLEPRQAVLQDIPVIQQELNETLDSKDARYVDFTGKLTKMAKDEKLDDDEIKSLIHIRQLIHRATDDTHQGLRGFRNLVVVTCAVLAVMLVVAVIWHLINPNFLSLCTGGSASVCPNGTSTPHSLDLAEVVGVGLLAGLLAALLSLGKLQVTSPYNLPRVQVVLKAVAGATTALLGILILQSGLIFDAATTTGAAFLAYAALFGYSQELFTRIVDRHVSSLLSTKP